MSGTPPQLVRVRMEYEDECVEDVEARAEATSHSLFVVLSYEDGCSSSNR